MAPRVLLLALIVLGCSSAPEAALFSFPPSGGATQLEQAGTTSTGGSSAGNSSPLDAGGGGGSGGIATIYTPGSSGDTTMPQAGSGGMPMPTGGTAAGGSTAGQPSGGVPPLGGSGGQATAGTGGAGGTAEPVCTSAIDYAQCTGSEDGNPCSDEEFDSICGVGLDPMPWKHIAHPWVAGHQYCVSDQVVDSIYGTTGIGACSTSVYTCTDAKLCNQYAPNSLENSKTWKGFSTESGTWRQLRRGEVYNSVSCTGSGLGACTVLKNP